jgi:7-dehydrocholesterol reductase
MKTIRLNAPILLLLLCPPAVFIFWYTNVHLDGSFQQMGNMLWNEGLIETFNTIWLPYFFGSAAAWKMIAAFAAFELLLMKIVPGKRVEGPITPAGNIPIYKANGVACYLITLFAFGLGSFYFKWFSPSIIYDHFPNLLGALNLFSLGFCLFLYVKGRFYPSSSDAGVSGNVIFDYYWGTELYPRVFGWDIKMFTNCRFGMMSWPVILLSFAAKQQEIYGLSDSMCVSVALQLVYITKFFIWETGYLRSLDIMHDRAGYYICWGCLVWVPGIYTSPTLYLVNHPNHLGLFLSLAIFIIGTACILANFFADRQRQKVRRLQGDCLVWGKKPDLTLASYVTEKGESKQNVLLASGWWGISRHFHYVPEILGAFLWTVPAGFTHFLPYFYVVFLTILLLERAYRDDRRCAKKYGNDWQLYCQKVPYKIIPYVL